MRPNTISWTQWFKYNILFFIEHFLGHIRYQKYFGKIESNLIKKLEHQLKQKERNTDFRLITYQKGEYPKKIFNYRYPVIFKGAAKEWDCYKNWDLDYFAEKYGNIEVTLVNNKGLVSDTNQKEESILLKDYIELLKRGTDKYLKFSRIIHDQSSLRDEFDQKWLEGFKSLTSFGDLFYFFIGAKDTLTPIHNGFSRTIFIQVKGQKKWIFYPPEDRIFLNVRPERTNYFFSAANPYNENDPKYPLLKYAHKIEFILEEGDVLFFPPYAFHQVENLTETIGVAYKFADLPSGFYSSKIMSFLYFFSTDPPVFNSTAHLWKNKKETASPNTYGNTI